LIDPFSRGHVEFTTEWLTLLRQTADQSLADPRRVRDSEG